MIEEPKINRNLALELLRVTEAGAPPAAPPPGPGQQEAADAPAREADRHPLGAVGLEGDRNRDVIAQIRDVGARIKLITAGDVAAALEAALETRSGVHCMMGSGGAPKACSRRARSRRSAATCRRSSISGTTRRSRWPLKKATSRTRYSASTTFALAPPSSSRPQQSRPLSC